MAAAAISRTGMAVVVALAAAAGGPEAVWIDLPPTGTKCVSEEIQPNVVVLADYAIMYESHLTAHPTVAVKLLSSIRSRLFTSLNSPGQLKGYQASGGDPCGQSWQGITCSGSSVTAILGLYGNLAYNMNSMASLVEIDMSQNNLGGGQPLQYNLPSNKLERLNLAGNQFSGNLPYSIFSMSNLKYLNLNHNQLQGNITDVFSSLYSLTTLDLSFTSLTGNLPQGFTSLSSLKKLKEMDFYLL